MMQRHDLRLAGGVVAVLVLLAVACAALVAVAARRHFDELTQRLNVNIAMYVDREAQLLQEGHPNHEKLQEISRHAMVVNPLVQVYLIDLDGNVVAGGKGRVDMAPVQRWLTAQNGPVYGEDPSHPGKRSVFSVHPVTGGGGYVYVVLGGAQLVGVSALIASSQVLSVTLLLLVSVIVASAAIAVAIDRRMRRARIQLQTLRSIDDDRRRLFESIGHDLRTPLSAACGYLEVLEGGDHLQADTRREYLAIVSAHCQRLARLVSQIFRLARLESPGVLPSLEPVSVSDLALDIGARFERAVSSESRRVALEIDQDVPHVLADCELLETAIENLLDNAIRHGGSEVAPKLSVVRESGEVLVSVRDHGRGLDPPLMHASSGGRSDRQGLGLIIVQRALELLGSRLEVRSSPGCGTTMSFRLAVMNS